MFQNHEAPVANKVAAVTMPTALLFVTGVLVSVVAALAATKWLRQFEGEGWIYLGSTSIRLVALLVGCTTVYVVASPGAGGYIIAFALGVMAGWLGHISFALVALRK
jgi:hypothetical protein